MSQKPETTQITKPTTLIRGETKEAPPTTPKKTPIKERGKHEKTQIIGTCQTSRPFMGGQKRRGGGGPTEKSSLVSQQGIPSMTTETTSELGGN